MLIIFDPSTFHAYHYAYGNLWLDIDYVDLICVVSGSDWLLWVVHWARNDQSESGWGASSQPPTIFWKFQPTFGWSVLAHTAPKMEAHRGIKMEAHSALKNGSAKLKIKYVLCNFYQTYFKLRPTKNIILTHNLKRPSTDIKFQRP